MRRPNPPQKNVFPIRSVAGPAIFVVIAAVAVLNGCSDPKPTVSGIVSLEESDHILDRCVAAYAGTSTVHAKGILRDFRHGERREVPISWDLARPSRCRLQIDRDLAIVHGADCWTYRSATGRFQGSRAVSAAPIERTSQLLSDGVPFLLPALWERGAAALGKERLGGFAGWRLQGVVWSSDRPCYVFMKKIASPEREDILRIWVDQDVQLIRGWSIVAPLEDGREKTVMECVYHELVVNGRLSAEVFQIRPPEPLGLPEGSATSEESAEPPGGQP